MKRARLARLERFRANSQFIFELTNIVDAAAIERVFAQNTIESVVHLAAQAGVRHSITHPQDYIDSNLTGFLNMLQAVRARPVRHFVYASSSSVYGATRSCRFRATGLIARSACMQQQSVPTSRWRTFIRGNSVSRDRLDFHRVRPVGAAGYGNVQIHQSDTRR